MRKGKKKMLKKATAEQIIELAYYRGVIDAIEKNSEIIKQVLESEKKRAEKKQAELLKSFEKKDAQ